MTAVKWEIFERDEVKAEGRWEGRARVMWNWQRRFHMQIDRRLNGDSGNGPWEVHWVVMGRSWLMVGPGEVEGRCPRE